MVTLKTFALPASIDPLQVGGQSGFLWASGSVCLAGLGVHERIPVTLAETSSVARATAKLSQLLRSENEPPNDQADSGAVAFGALPFNRRSEGELIVPRIVLGTDGNHRWLTIVDHTLSLSDAMQELESLGAANQEPTQFNVRSVLTPENWRDEIVANVIAAIKSGRLNKAVLARELEVRANSDFEPSAVLGRLHTRYPTAIRFRVEGFLGASPELLVARSANVVSAHPLAGTATRFEDPTKDAASSEDLEASIKDQWEHRITINWLLDNLVPFCSYVDAEPEPQIVTLANVHHLGTRVEGRLSSPAANVLELVAALHPTPAVGGAPQDEALRIIDEIERAERGQYAGPVGWVDSSGNGAFAVGIRSALINGNIAKLFAGVGVVADSDPAMELAETEAKFQTMRDALLGAETQLRQ